MGMTAFRVGCGVVKAQVGNQKGKAVNYHICAFGQSTLTPGCSREDLRCNKCAVNCQKYPFMAVYSRTFAFL